MIDCLLCFWKFRCSRIAEFPFSGIPKQFGISKQLLGTPLVRVSCSLRVLVVLLGFAAFAENSEAQPKTDLRVHIKESIHDVADSLFRMNGEEWSGTVWSDVPDLRRTGKSSPVNGFALEELTVEQLSSAVDPSGQSLSQVSITIRGSLLMSDGRIVLVDVEHPASILGSNDQSFEEQYPDLLKKDSSLWSNIIRPAIVALGAAAVIALFFIVRS